MMSRIYICPHCHNEIINLRPERKIKPTTKSVIEGLQRNETYQSIADNNGITKQRVGQIAHYYGLNRRYYVPTEKARELGLIP